MPFGIGRQLEDLRRPAHVVTHGSRLEKEVEVLLLELHGGRQDDVGEARRLVHVDVDRDHEIDLLEGASETLAVGGG